MQFEGVEETMLIPLVIRANETKRKNARIKDLKAVEIIEKAEKEFQNLDKFDRFMSREGVVARTILFDRAVKSCVEKYPDAIFVSVGCGLDARFQRVDNGRIDWYNLDFEKVIEARKRFFDEPSERVHLIAKSALCESWAGEIKTAPGRKVIFIIEGVLMYFSESEVKKFLNIVKSGFKNVIILAELLPAFAVGKEKMHDTLKSTKASFRWGVKSGKEVEPLCDGLKLLDEKSFNMEMKKYSFRGFLFGTLPVIKNMNDRLAVYSL